MVRKRVALALLLGILILYIPSISPYTTPERYEVAFQSDSCSDSIFSVRNSTLGDRYIDRVLDIAIDDDGYVYTVGWTWWNYGPVSDHVLAKWDPNGDLVWAEYWNGGYQASGFGLVVSGNYIYTIGKLFDVGDILLMKWSTSGDLVWNKSLDFYTKDEGMSINIDSGGNLIIYGGSEGIIDDEWNYVTYLMKLNGESTEQLWNITSNLALIYVTYGYDIEIDSTGNIYTLNFNNNGIGKWNSSGGRVWDEYLSFGGYSMAIGPNDEVYSCHYNDSEEPTALLYRWNSTGGAEWSFDLNHRWAEAMTVKGDGTIFVLATDDDEPKRELMSFDANGNSLCNATLLDDSWEPRGSAYKCIHLAVVDEGYLYIGGTRDTEYIYYPEIHRDSWNKDFALSSFDLYYSGSMTDTTTQSMTTDTNTNGNSTTFPSVSLILPIGVLGTVIVAVLILIILRREAP